MEIPFSKYKKKNTIFCSKYKKKTVQQLYAVLAGEEDNEIGDPGQLGRDDFFILILVSQNIIVLFAQ